MIERGIKMSKKLLSILLVISMLLTMLSVPVMAQEENTNINLRGEIIALEPLDEIENTVDVGTTIADLELPTNLRAKVRNYPETVTDNVYGLKEETTVDIPVTWTSEPKYDMDTEGEYVFTPVIEGYILEFEPGYVAQIGETGYSSLQAAVNAVESGGTIKLLEDIDLWETVTVSDNKNFTLDLKGKTINSRDKTAIKHNGSGELTITDSSREEEQGKITSGDPSSTTEIKTVELTSSGTLNITGGTVESTNQSGRAIYVGFNSSGTVNVSGGTVIASNNYGNAIKANAFSFPSQTSKINVSGGKVVATNGAISAISGGMGQITISDNALVTSSASGSSQAIALGVDSTLNIQGGRVEHTAGGIAIDSASRRTNSINISGGTVSAKNNMAIYNTYNGKITISDNAVVTSANTTNTSGTIYLKEGSASDTVLEIIGGTVQNTSATGNAIYNNASGKIMIPRGTPIIQGGGKAMNTAPDLSDYANVAVTASTKYDGSETVAYDPENITSYRYLTFAEKLDTVVSNLNLTDKLAIPATGGTPVTSINDSQYTGTVEWDGNPTVFVTNTIYTATVNLTAREGYTFSGVAANAFEHQGASSVTNAAGSGYTMTVTVTFPMTVAKMSQEISYATDTVDKIYGDDNFINSLTQTTVDGAITYTSDNTSVAVVDANTGEVTIVGSGSATITATAMETATHAGATASYTVTVAKKALTIKAEDKSMKKGEALPDFTYTVTGLVKGDTVISAPSLSTTTDGTVVGTFDITITGGVVANAANYDITYINGALTVAEVLYTVTVTDGTGSGTYAEGTTVTITANDRSGYTFTDWTSVDVTFTDATAKTTTFTMPAKAVTITANYRQNTSGGSGSGSGGGGRTSRDSSTGNIIITPPTSEKPDAPTQAQIKVPVTIDDNNNAILNITSQMVTDAFEKALVEAKKNGNEENGIALVLNVDTGNTATNTVIVNLPKVVQDTIIKKKIVNTIIVVDNPDIQISMDLPTVEEINRQANADVNVTATPEDNHKLTEEGKTAIGNRPVFDLKVSYGSGRQVENFGDGRVTVTISYTLGANEKAENIYAVYIDDNGRVHWLTDSVYDREKQVLRFSTNHFSLYGVGYKEEIIKEIPVFTDIEGHWAKENIEFVVREGLFSGTSETTFSPNMAMTRGMFVTVLGKMAKADVKGYKDSSFSDVKTNAYYMGYIEWAGNNNIIKGIGNGKFAPDQPITREEMAVIMKKYAQINGFTLSKLHEERTFADSEKISGYAKESVKEMQMAGIMSGKNGNQFDPQGIATRAEVSTVLCRFVELVFSM